MGFVALSEVKNLNTGYFLHGDLLGDKSHVLGIFLFHAPFHQCRVMNESITRVNGTHRNPGDAAIMGGRVKIIPDRRRAALNRAGGGLQELSPGFSLVSLGNHTPS